MVLILVGIVLTPMQAVLETLIAKRGNRPIAYLHACENVAQHSFKKRNQVLAKNHNVSLHTW